MLNYKMKYDQVSRCTNIYRSDTEAVLITDAELPILEVPDGNPIMEKLLNNLFRIAETSHRGVHSIPNNPWSKTIINRLSRGRIFPEISNYRMPEGECNTLEHLDWVDNT